MSLHPIETSSKELEIAIMESTVSAELFNKETSSDISSRPSKRQRFYRKRADVDNEDENNPNHPASSSISISTDSLTIEELISQNSGNSNVTLRTDEVRRLPVAEILRQRKAAQRRRGGIEFSNSTLATTAILPADDADTENHDDTVGELKTVVDRFAPQTGQVADVDKHMMAYIDSELVKRRQGTSKPSSTSQNQNDLDELSENGGLIDAGLNRQPAALGKLHEIDLGPDATLRNIARTEAAKRRLEGGGADVDEWTGKVRLRRDGKPYRRKRRNSDDMKRDKLVEEVMRESRLEIYDEPEADLAPDDQAADDRIAEQFRRDFMDAISSRRQRTSAAAKIAKANANRAPGQKKEEERPRGPKLGGSRSARAAMREMQEKAAAGGKK